MTAVTTTDAPLSRSFEVADRLPFHIPGALAQDACKRLIADWAHDPEAFICRSEDGQYLPDLVQGSYLPEWAGTEVRTLLVTLAGLFGLPVDLAATSCVVLKYNPGGEQGWHSDASGDLEHAAHRTVSFSVLLNEPGIDYTGGDLEFANGWTPDEQLHVGDLIGFTARTRHRIRPVTAGARYVLVVFGSAP
jgi:hypothetical protein